METTDPKSGSAYHWYVLALLFVIATINTIDRNLVPALAEPIRSEFNLSDSQFGFLAGMVFAISYSLVGIPIGLLIDRVNRSRFLAGLLAAWSGATMFGGLVTSFPGLILARTAVAAAESGGNPTSMSLISDYFPKSRRGTAIGIYFGHGAIALFLVFTMAGFVAANYGWRTAFFLAGAPGLVLSVLVVLTLREPKRGTFDPLPNKQEPRPGLSAILKVMLGNRTLLLLSSAAVLTIVGQTGISAFLTAFYIRLHGLPIEQAGIVVGLILGGASAIGTPVGGILADVLSRRSPGGGCYFVAGLTLFSIPLAIFGLVSSNLVTSVVFLFVYKVLISSFYGATFATFLGEAPVIMRGALMAFLLVAMNLVGYGFGPQIAGIFSDLFRLAGIANPLRWALVLVTGVFVFSSLLYFLAGRSLQMQRSPATN